MVATFRCQRSSSGRAVGYCPLRKLATTVSVLEALWDVRVDGEIIHPPRWIGTDAAQLIENRLKEAGGSWDPEANGYKCPTAAVSVLQGILEGSPRPGGNRLATFETPEALADRMRGLAGVSIFDHVLEPSAGQGRLIANLPRKQEITAIEIDPAKAAYLAMMPHCREGAMSVSQTNFLGHVGKGPGYFGTLFDVVLMTPPRHQNEDVRHVMAAWDCLAPGGTLVAVFSPGWEHPAANETELLLFRRWFATVQAHQEELPEDTFTESAPPMQSRLIWAIRDPLVQ
jgi:hypothetical protein